jgi:ATPase subunit of ABC transporter with duplicated ATPase domains
MLLLDEPTNHLDAETIAWLQQHLIDYKGTILIVTHDRYFLDDITGWILELDRGRGIPYEGNYSSWLEQKAKRLEQEAREDKSRQKTLERELEWIRQGAKARQAKSEGPDRPLQRAGQPVRARKDRPRPDHHPQRPAPRLEGDRGGEPAKAHGRQAADRGSELLPAAGRHRRRDRPERRRQDPRSSACSPGRSSPMPAPSNTATRWSCLCRPVPRRARWGQDRLGGDLGRREVIELGDAQMNSRAYCSAFNFKGGDQQKKVGLLSGGERNRVHMAKLLKSGGNVLLLDEPTNDLDVETLRALEDALVDFAGCAVVISHDRFFLDRICTHILAFEGEAHVEWFEGNFEDYEEDKKRRLGPDAVEPEADEVQEIQA